MDGSKDLLLLIRLNADAAQGFPCSAVRADERFIVQPGKRRRFTKTSAASGADGEPNHVILLHGTASLCSDSNQIYSTKRANRRGYSHQF